METNTKKAKWPMRVELRTVESVYAAEFGIDVNAENGETVGWRVVSDRLVEIDSAFDAGDLAGYIWKERDLRDGSDFQLATDHEDMRRDAEMLERISEREGDE